MAPKDERFASRLATDPRFIRPKSKSTKIAVDERFQTLFDDQDEDSNKVDKYGRKVGKKEGSKQLRQFYRLDNEKPFVDLARGEVLLESSSEEEDDEGESESSDEEVELGPNAASKRKRRASSELSIDLSEDVTQSAFPPSDEEEEDEVAIEQSVPTGDATKRIAVVNLDWDNVRAIDLYKVFSSVLSSTPSASSSKAKGIKIGQGRVNKVTIYPSQFGKQRMETEEREGPPKGIFGPEVDSDNDDVDIDDIGEDDVVQADKGEEYDEQALRRYQLERLRYFYAVVEFDSVQAAQHAYEEIDNTEFEATANMFDLRYIPNDTEFNEDKPHDEASADQADYKGVAFVTDALRNSKVKLTWDAEDPQRTKITRINPSHLSKDDLERIDFQAYLASSGSESDSDSDAAPTKKLSKNEKRDRMRAMYGLDGPDEEEDDGGMEITFTPALDNDGSDSDSDTLAAPKRPKELRDTDADDFFDVDSDEAGPSEPKATSNGKLSHKEAKKARKAAKEASEKEQAALSLLVDDDEDLGAKQHFDMKEILRAEKTSSKKRKHQKNKKADTVEGLQDNFQIDVQDDRFKGLFESHEYAVDPSNAKYVKTKNMEKLLEEGRKRRKTQTEDVPTADKKSKQKDNNLDGLVDKIKRSSKGSKSGKKRH